MDMRSGGINTSDKELYRQFLAASRAAESENILASSITVDGKIVIDINTPQDAELYKELIGNNILITDNDNDSDPRQGCHFLDKKQLHRYCSSNNNFARTLAKNSAFSRIIPPGEQIKRANHFLSKLFGAVIGGLLGFLCGIFKAGVVIRNVGQRMNAPATALSYLTYGPIRGFCHGWRGGITQVHKGSEAILTALEYSHGDDAENKYILPWDFYYHKASIADMAEEAPSLPETPPRSHFVATHFLGVRTDRRYTEMMPKKDIKRVDYTSLSSQTPGSPPSRTDLGTSFHCPKSSEADQLSLSGHPVYGATASTSKKPAPASDRGTLRL